MALKIDEMGRKRAVSICGIPNQNGNGDFYAEVGSTFQNTGILVSAITVSADGRGGSGFFDIVRVYADFDQLLWEGPLSGLEGVNYVC